MRQSGSIQKMNMNHSTRGPFTGLWDKHQLTCLNFSQPVLWSSCGVFFTCIWFSCQLPFITSRVILALLWHLAIDTRSLLIRCGTEPLETEPAHNKTLHSLAAQTHNEKIHSSVEQSLVHVWRLSVNHIPVQQLHGAALSQSTFQHYHCISAHAVHSKWPGSLLQHVTASQFCLGISVNYVKRHTPLFQS